MTCAGKGQGGSQCVSNLGNGYFCRHTAEMDRRRCECCRARARRQSASYRANHTILADAYASVSKQASHLRRKLRALQIYGNGSCGCCGEARYQFLTLDHPNGDGDQHRKLLNRGMAGPGFLRQLEKLGWPTEPEMRVLCANCHLAIDMWRGCPHEQEN